MTIKQLVLSSKEKTGRRRQCQHSDLEPSLQPCLRKPLYYCNPREHETLLEKMASLRQGSITSYALGHNNVCLLMFTELLPDTAGLSSDSKYLSAPQYP